MNKAVIGLGSNIDPHNNITLARKLLGAHFAIISESRFIETEPIGFTDQDNFINGSIYIETSLTQNRLKQTLKAIEDEMGRVRSEIKFGPRSIDLDIVVFNGKVIDQDFYERDFLKNSVLEILPELEY